MQILEKTPPQIIFNNPISSIKQESTPDPPVEIRIQFLLI